MKYFVLLKEYIRHGKSNFISTFLFVFIITVSLCTVVTVWKNAGSYEQQELERVGYGTVGSWVPVLPETAELEQKITSLPETDDVTVQEVFLIDDFWVADTQCVNSGQLVVYEPGEQGYYIYNETLRGKEKNPKELQSGEVYIPQSFRTIYSAKLGDEIIVDTGKEEKHFHIKGYFEDPVMGGAVMGIKTILISKADMEDLKESCEEAGTPLGMEVNWYHITMKQDAGITQKEFQRILNEKTDLSNYAILTYTQSAMKNFMLILHNIFSGFLLVFLTVLLLITLLVMNHNITAAMEQDYVDIGILKAIGFRRGDIQLVKLLQYLLPVLGGMILGIPVAVPIVGLVNRIIAPATGIMIPAGLAIGICTAALGIILLVFVIMVYTKTFKLGKITPVRAIRGGREDIYFKSCLQLPIFSKGLSIHLALRQLIFGKKQYISTFFVTALLVFFLSLNGRLDVWLGEDGSGLIACFVAAPQDLGVRYSDEEVREEAEDLISSHTKIMEKYQMNGFSGAVNHMDYYMNVISVPECYQVYEGRSCLYKNETVITETVAEELGIAIGDSVIISYEDNSKEFIVTGLYQCANDMGANFGISSDGFEWLGGEWHQSFCWYYIVEEKETVAGITGELEECFGDSISIGEAIWSGMESVRLAMTALEILMYVMSVIFILVVIIMTGNKIFYKEQHDIGIEKAIGFPSGKLRVAFALRFVFVAAAGSLAGIVLSGFLTDPLVGSILKFTGVSQFSSEISLAAAIVPALVVMAIFFAFAYLASRKIKRVTPVVLMTE